jgi:hypothetical protein
MMDIWQQVVDKVWEQSRAPIRGQLDGQADGQVMDKISYHVVDYEEMNVAENWDQVRRYNENTTTTTL